MTDEQVLLSGPSTIVIYSIIIISLQKFWYFFSFIFEGLNAETCNYGILFNLLFPFLNII